MSIIKNVVIAIVASFVVCGHIQTSYADPVTATELAGKWYRIAFMVNKPIPFKMSCAQIIVKRVRTDALITISSSLILGNETQRLAGIGTIMNSVVYIQYPNYHTDFIVKGINFINNGEEFTSKALTVTNQPLELFSRNTTVSQETLEKFVNNATVIGFHTQHVNHTNCQY